MICNNPYLVDNQRHTLHIKLCGEQVLIRHEYLGVRGQQLLTLHNLDTNAPSRLVNQQTQFDRAQRSYLDSCFQPFVFT